VVRRTGAALATFLVAAPISRADGQGLPPYQSLNPVITSRSGLYFQPYIDAGAGWQLRLQLDYGSSVEYVNRPTARFVLDGEHLRLDAIVVRNLGSAFFGAEAALRGAYDGFLDGFLDWYHDLTGFRVSARAERPRNAFDYFLELPDGRALRRQPSSGFLGDARIFVGHRHTRHWQTTLAATLPTSTGPTGYGRGTVSASAITTVRSSLGERLRFEGSFGLGVTPRHGELEDLQRTFFQSASGGVRFRFWGRQAAFLNLFYQSASYRGSSLRALDQRELTLDYGFLLKARKGPEWFLGMTEDLEPKGPAIDLAFRIGARW
jgi:hypothetical protein